jgi:predicted glycoside hydrolase/deacetylase ChbG (UPF0249 family)
LISRREFLASSGVALAAIACGRPIASGISPSLSVWDRLKLPPETRAIILHADDAGIAHSVNAAIFDAFEKKAIDSCSVMVPCEAFPEFASWSSSHKSADVGVHLTLTSSPNVKSRPVLESDKVRSLIDIDGNFPVALPATREFSLAEADAELRAQISKAAAMGIDVTHIDGHQHIVQLRSEEMFEVFLRIATDNRLPFRSAKSWYTRAPWLAQGERATIPLERLISPGGADAKTVEWSGWYADRVRSIPPGLSELFMHPGYDTPELRTLLPDTKSWGSDWRQRDFDMLFSPELATALRDTKAVRIGWRRIRDAIRMT